MSMPAGWYDDPFTDHLQRYWNGESWTKEIRPLPDLESAPSPATAQGAASEPVRDYLLLSILALIFCAWPLAIPALIFAIRANGAKKQGDMAQAAESARRARLFVILSVVLGIIVWIYLGFLIATTDIPTDQGTLTPFNA